MIDRRKFMLASVAGVVAPICAALAQPAPDHMDGHAMDDHGHPDDHGPAERPRMPPLRHEDRPRSPGAAYHWRAGHWNWGGRDWQWVGGVWYR